MEQAEIENRKRIAENKLRTAGAHYIIDTLANLPAVIEDINQRIANNQKP